MRVFVIIAFRHLTNIEIMVIGIYCREKNEWGTSRDASSGNTR